MATKRKEASAAKVDASVFPRAQILESARFYNHRDLVSVLAEENETFP